MVRVILELIIFCILKQVSLYTLTGHFIWYTGAAPWWHKYLMSQLHDDKTTFSEEMSLRLIKQNWSFFVCKSHELRCIFTDRNIKL